ncbi:MAG: hypothetical protein DCC68_02640 [Planctomycetota bacterium]|nr:MAG: hypothetical protein DCC68_02640 [Planctomycetota bacterium]
MRTYIPEPQRKHDNTWTDKPPEYKAAVYATRRRTRGERGKALQRKRSEVAERTFAHVCETGGAPSRPFRPRARYVGNGGMPCVSENE